MGCQPLHSGPCKAWHSTCCHVAPLVRKDLLAQFYDRFLTGVPGQEVSSIELRDLGWKEGLKRLIPYCPHLGGRMQANTGILYCLILVESTNLQVQGHGQWRGVYSYNQMITGYHNSQCHYAQVPI